MGSIRITPRSEECGTWSFAGAVVEARGVGTSRLGGKSSGGVCDWLTGIGSETMMPDVGIGPETMMPDVGIGAETMPDGGNGTETMMPEGGIGTGEGGARTGWVGPAELGRPPIGGTSW